MLLTWRATWRCLALLSVGLGTHAQTACQGLLVTPADVFVTLGCPTGAGPGTLRLAAGSALHISGRGGLSPPPRIIDLELVGGTVTIDLLPLGDAWPQISGGSVDPLDLISFDTVSGSANRWEVVGCAPGCVCDVAVKQSALAVTPRCALLAPRAEAGEAPAPAPGGAPWWVWLVVGLSGGLCFVLGVLSALVWLHHRRRKLRLPVLDGADPIADRGGGLHWSPLDPFCTPAGGDYFEQQHPPAYFPSRKSPASTPPRVGAAGVFAQFSPASTIFGPVTPTDPDGSSRYGDPPDFLVLDHLGPPGGAGLGAYSIPSTARSGSTNAAAWSDRSAAIYQFPAYPALSSARIHEAL